MTAAGRVVSLQICPGHRKPMVPVPRAVLIENLGLEHDMHALPDSARQVLLLESETLAELRLAPGEVKENITTAGIALMRLPRGQRLLLGSEVLLEITKPCSPCARMEELRPGLLAQIGPRRGMLARVLRGGAIAPGDAIACVEG